VPSVSTGARGSGPFFYGWWIVASVFVMMACVSGLAFYSQAVLLEALSRERGFAIGATSLATTIFFASSGLMGLLVAWFIDRFDIRLAVTAGATISAAALVAIGRVGGLGEMYAAFALFGVGFACTNLVPGTTLITRWFVRQRALALAIASTGLSVGGIVITPFVARAVGRHGLAEATPWIALGLVIGVVPLVWWRLVDRPERLGLRPDGGDPPPNARAARPSPVVVPAPFRTRFFYWMSATFLFGLCAQVGALSHHFNLVRESAGAGAAELAVSVVAASSIVGRFTASWLVSFVAHRPLAIVLLCLQAGALVTLGQATTPAALLACSSFFGLTVGSFLLMQSLLVAEAFGILRYPRVYSASALVGSVGLSAGPVLLGIVHDQSGYAASFAVAAGCSVLGALCLVIAGRLPSSRLA
jgi:MFS family permease